MFFLFVQIAIISVFKSYPTVGDIALYMAFLPVWSHLYRCEFSLCSLLTCSAELPPLNQVKLRPQPLVGSLGCLKEA